MRVLGTRGIHSNLRDVAFFANEMLNSANDSWKSLSSLAEVLEARAENRIDFLQQCQAGAFDGALVVYRTFESVEFTGRFNEEVVWALPASVKFVCHNGKHHFPLIYGLKATVYQFNLATHL